MSTPPPHRPRAAHVVAPVILAALALLSALATDAAAQEEPRRGARVTTSVGLMAGVPGLGAGSGSLAGVLDARVSFRATRRLAWTIGATYARANGTSGWCTPDGDSTVDPECLTYDEEALVAAVGVEYELHARPVGDRALRVALTSDVGAGGYHTVRHGTVSSFPLSPTRWHLMGPIASLGLLVARPIGTRMEGVVAGRLVAANLWTVLYGVAPTPQPALSVGLRW